MSFIILNVILKTFFKVSVFFFSPLTLKLLSEMINLPIRVGIPIHKVAGNLRRDTGAC